MNRVSRIMKMTGKPRSTVLNILNGGAHAERYGAETRQAVLGAAADLQERAQLAARKRRETMRRKRVRVVVLCLCGEENCFDAPTAWLRCELCDAAGDPLRLCSCCRQLVCVDCLSGWETRPDLGRLHALVCRNCATTSRRDGARGNNGNGAKPLLEGGRADEKTPTGSATPSAAGGQPQKKRQMVRRSQDSL